MAEFKCQACGAVFTSQEDLMNHAKASHPQAQQQQQQAAPVFKCQACGAEFKSEAELQAHGKSAHGM